MSSNSASRRWRENNPEKVREYKKKYYTKYKKTLNAKRQIYYQNNKERLKDMEKKRWASNREALRAKRNAQRAANPKRFNDYAQKFRDKNPASGYWSSTKRNAIRLGVAFDLDMEWFKSRISSGVCELSGLPFEFKTAGRLRKRNPNTPSVDRINPSGPYTKANCRLILWWLNSALSNRGEDYALSVFRAILIKRGEMLPYEQQEAA